MKKVYLSFGILSALALTSCEQADMLTGASHQEATSMTITASGLQTRTAIDGLTVKWAQGDQVGMFCGGISANTPNVLFDVTPGEEGHNATLKSSGDMHWAFNDDTYVYGYYPYSAAVANGTEATFALPATQEQSDAKGAQLSKYDYLVAAPVKSATGEGINVTFDHVMSWIDFAITNDDNKDITVNSVDFVCDNALVSTAKIDLSAQSGADGFLKFTSPTTTSTLSVKASVADGDTWNVVKAGETVTLRMAMFPCDLSGKDFKMVAHTSEGDFTVNKAGAGKNIERASRYTGKILLFFPSLEVGTPVNFASTGGEQDVTITTNMEWTIDEAKVPSYVHISPMSGNGNSTIKVVVDPMSGDDPDYPTGRGVVIPVKGLKDTTYSKDAKLEIRQNGNSGTSEVEFKGEIKEVVDKGDL